jgi:hypothetical protein
MPDEQTDKIVRLLEELRDLTKERNNKLESYLQTTRQRYEDALQRQKDAQARTLLQRRRFLWTLTPILLIAIGLMAYIGFWVIPKSDQKDAERWTQQMRMIETNQMAQPH